MRAILIDWIIEVHLKFKLNSETLYLTVNLIDRYLAKDKIERRKLQLLGVSAMLIASKYEEIYSPEIRDFVYITDHTYSKEEIIKQEYKILTTLNFDIYTVSPYRFMERMWIMCSNDKKVFYLAQYILELTLIEYKMISYIPSIKAASSIYLARKILKIQPCWPKNLEKEFEYTETTLRTCAKEMCGIIGFSQKKLP